jgi:DNA-binding NtrC family response regulator
MQNHSRRLRVLLLDDDPCVTEIVEEYLKVDFGDAFRVLALNDACRAMEWLEHHGCDLLISDIEMPGCDGLEMLRFAKQRNPWVPVIFMTAHSTWDRIAEAVEIGASDYLLKPIDRGELFQVVAHERARLTRWRNAVMGTLSLSMQHF